MKKLIPLLLVLAATLPARAQDEEKHPSETSKTYHHARQRTTTPPYGIEKIRALLPKMKAVPDKDNEDAGTEGLSATVYSSLSLREKFTYNMIHGESYFQNCDINMPSFDEEKKIFGELPGVFGEENWSDRQRKFFKDNKDSVIGLIRESIGRTHYVGLNYKQTLVDINATEMIPFLVDFYKQQRKDHDILTVLLLLMLNNNYPPFMSSQSFNKLYAKGVIRYEAYLAGNTANQDLIMQRATDFYNGLQH
jgi:hypothetical protein